MIRHDAMVNLGTAGAESFWVTPTPNARLRCFLITFSALGQKAPIEEKKQWDPDFAKRKKMQARLNQLIPEFSVRLGGTTSVDVTKLGIDKGYGMAKLRDTLGIGFDDMLFIGDALFPGGNDYPAKAAGVQSIQVRDPNEAKRVIETILACIGHGESSRLQARNE
jgi:hypothetical protein